ncbi:MAG: hypothetical protein ACLVHS_04610 [Blautia wexlerae]
MTKKQAREKVLEMFRKLGIPDPEERIDCYPHQFLRWNEAASCYCDCNDL